ncbi:MAG: hypothetical protein QNI99_21355 [Woeseiaceae bacterium]|nr:hypothetical protein [Woeseiaceae bacterium]
MADATNDPESTGDSGYTVEQHDDLMIVRIVRELDLPEAISVVEEFSTRELPAKRLWVFGGYVKLRSPEALRELGNLARMKHQQPGRVAYVVEGDIDFGLTNVLASSRHMSGFEYSIFRDEGSALSWLDGENQS